jgi:hypothetical protein
MKYLLVFLLLIPSVMYSQNAIEKEKGEIILEYILGDELKAASESFFERQIQNVKHSYPDLSDSVWNNVRANIDAKSAFLDTVVEAYQSKMSIDELREIKKVFNTPAFIKLKKVGAEISELFPTMAVECGRKIMNKIREYLDNHLSESKK